MEYITERNASLIGVSDASVIEGNGTHAWILTTGEKNHISDPYMKLEGYGTVDGDTIAMSSAHGELQGQTALTIITEAFLTEHDAKEMAVTFYTDNLGVQKSCTNPKINRIGHHRKANMDLQMERASRKAKMNIKHEWVRGHQDNDHTWDTVDELCELQLTPAATLNIYCDRKASDAHKLSMLDSNGEVLPAEKWALFSNYPNPRKITGKINEGIMQSLHTEAILEYISKKHNLTEDKLYHMDINELQHYLKSLRPHNRASIVKLIHQWIPTNDFMFKQRRAESPLCSRYKSVNEDAHHILTCSLQDAQAKRTEALYECLKFLENANTSRHILESLECELSILLQVNSTNTYKATVSQTTEMKRKLTDAIKHQNIVGWENALRGYTSKYWMEAQRQDQHTMKDSKKRSPWNITLIRSLRNLHMKIWSDRNTHIYGTSLKENYQKLRQRTLEQVKNIYNKNAKLAPRYQAIKTIPLETRLCHTTQRLQQWIARIKHQKTMTEYLMANDATQLTIQEAFQRAKRCQEHPSKYPP